jgi:hypothetical protein
MCRGSAFKLVGGDGFGHRLVYFRRCRLWAGFGVFSLETEGLASAAVSRWDSVLPGGPNMVGDASALER